MSKNIRPSTSKITFGCGSFLPGLGPGNVTEFDSGGTIDSGGGFGNEDPDPPTKIDPPGDIGPGDTIGDSQPPGPSPPPVGVPGTPTSPNQGPPITPGGSPGTPGPGVPDTAPPPATSPGAGNCRCIPNPDPVSEDTSYTPGSGGSNAILTYTVTRVYSQTCTEFSSKEEADNAVGLAREVFRSPAPPGAPGAWVQVGSTEITGGPIGKRCGTSTGCGGECPNVTVVSRWRRFIPPPPPPPPPSPRPNVKGVPDAGDAGGATTPGGSIPGTPPPVGLSIFKCIPNPQPISSEVDRQPKSPCGAWYTKTEVFSQDCQEFQTQEDADAAVKQGEDIINNPSPPLAGDGGAVAPDGPPEITGGDSIGQSCGAGGGGECPDITVVSRWEETCLEPPDGPPPPPPAGGGLIFDGNLGIDGGVIFNEDLDDAGPTIVVNGGGPSNANFEAVPPPILPSTNTTGGGVSFKKYSSQDDISQQAIRSGELNLDDPSIVNSVLQKKPFGIQDDAIAFITNPPAPEQVTNDSSFSDFFKNKIDSNLLYVLKNTNNNANWDSRRAAAITPELIFNNLNDNVKEILSRIRNFDGSKLNQRQIFSMIGSRVLDGTLRKLSISYLQQIAEDSEKRVPVTITRSGSQQVNEVAALALIDRNKFPLDIKSVGSIRDAEVIRNWKVVPSDVDMYIPFDIDGVTRRFYINDDETFIDRVTLSLQDGNYFDIIGGGIRNQRLFAESEVDHAYYIPESTRQKAIQILGGEPGRTLTVSADAATASSIEYDSSLTSPRQSYYLLSGVLNTLETEPSITPSYLLKDSRMEYRLIDTTTAAGQAAADEYIKYKANKRIFVIDHEDLILDYIEETGSVYLSQTDILADSPKENKTLPLLTRQIPWYIMVVPTNRTDYNLFNSKSTILEIARDGAMTRRLKCKTSIVPEFSKRQTNKFIKYSTVGQDGTDVLGNKNTQARQTIIEVNDSDFKKTYSVGGKLVGTDEYTPNRNKSAIRIVKEIITELDTNYELSLNGIGKSLTEFDVFSRLTGKQFNKLFKLENFGTIKRAIQRGLIKDVKLIPPVSRADSRIAFNKTQLVQRKTTAGEDTFKQIKATNTGLNITNPDENGVGGFTPAS